MSMSLEDYEKLDEMLMGTCGLPHQPVAELKALIRAYEKWHQSNQQFINATGTFATSGGVKDTRNRPCNRPGVYRYIHIPTNQCMYIGMTDCLNERVSGGKTIAKALVDGKQVNCSKYPAIPKLVARDSNLNNWRISYVETFSEYIASELEASLIQEENPAFNDPSMAGK